MSLANGINSPAEFFELEREPIAFGSYGYDLAGDGDDLLVISIDLLYIYRSKGPRQWEIAQQIRPNDIGEGLPVVAYFFAVEARNGKAIVSASRSDGSGLALLHLNKVESTWKVVELVEPPAKTTNTINSFGRSFGFSANFLAVGDPTAGDSSEGAVYIYKLLRGKWKFDSELKGERLPYSYLGASIQFTETSLVVGSTNKGYLGLPPPHDGVGAGLTFSLVSGKPVDEFRVFRGDNTTLDTFGRKVLTNEEYGLDFYPSHTTRDTVMGLLDVVHSDGVRQRINPPLPGLYNFARHDVFMFRELLFLSSQEAPGKSGVGLLHVYTFSSSTSNFSYLTTLRSPDNTSTFGQALAANKDTLFIGQPYGTLAKVYGLYLGQAVLLEPTNEPTTLLTTVSPTPSITLLDDGTLLGVAGALSGLILILAAAIVFVVRMKPRDENPVIKVNHPEYVESISARKISI